MKSLKYYIQAIENRTINYLYFHKGWTTNRKIVVIESDDWGSIRMPSIEILNYLLSNGVQFNLDAGYDKYDTLASNDDLELLFNILNSIRDKNGNNAKITLNTVVANPDFRKIKECNYTEFHYELFTETLKRYSNHDRVFALWQNGIEHKVIKPQFHAREHINVPLWLYGLKNDFPGTRVSFEKEVFSHLYSNNKNGKGHYLEAYNASCLSDYVIINESIDEGLDIFEKLFGYRSISMICPNYLWDNKIEVTAFNKGVKYIQGSIIQRNTHFSSSNLGRNEIFHYLGEKNINNQIYLTRNCLFEPSNNKKSNAASCLNDINIAFQHKKPATICSHRLNFIGGLDIKNRDRNLKEFSNLLKSIINKHPDVEFMSSDELGMIISDE